MVGSAISSTVNVPPGQAKSEHQDQQIAPARSFRRPRRINVRQRDEDSTIDHPVARFTACHMYRFSRPLVESIETAEVDPPEHPVTGARPGHCCMGGISRNRVPRLSHPYRRARIEMSAVVAILSIWR
jgi:hypothetical protein